MDLELQEVAELLNVTEDELLNWASKGTIPAYFINERYRFNRQEIEAWVLRQKESKSTSSDPAKDQVKTQGSLRFNLFRAINNGDVHQDIQGETKAAVIRAAMKRIAPQLRLDPEVLYELFMDREQLVPTAVGSGFAIPHARDFLLHGHRDMVHVVFLPKPIHYDALDGEPVHTLFFLLASDDKKHLGLLSKIAHLASNPSLRHALGSKPNKSELLELIKDWESTLGI